MLQGRILVADFAQESGGKLYVMGGGWTKITVPNVPTQMGVAVKIRGESAASTKRLNLVLQLVDHRKRVVRVGEGKKRTSLRIRATLERKESAEEAAPHDAALAVNTVVQLGPGRYEWQLLLGDRLADSWPFVVLAADKQGARSPRKAIRSKPRT